MLCPARRTPRASPCASPRAWTILLALAAGIAATSGSATPTPAAAAGLCANEQIRQAEPYASALPDCRAYEQVSPGEKNYADALGAITGVRGAPSGEAVTFDSLGPFPLGGGVSGEGTPQLFTTYASARGVEAWPTQNLEPAVSPGGLGAVLGVTEDLSYTFDLSDNRPPLVTEPAAIEGRKSVDIRDNRTGAYRLLFQLQAGEEVSFFLVGAVAGDSRVFFESRNQLVAGAALGVRNLYEWHEGQLNLVDLLPGGSPANGGAAGWRGPGAAEEAIELPDHSHGRVSYFVENAVSEDGFRVFFTDLGTGRLYVRESQPGGAGETAGVSQGPAAWLAATPDGSQVFYNEAGVLYRFDVASAHTVPLTPAGAEVQGVLGVAGDGSYLYFAAQAVLAIGAVAGAGNIYVWHEGAVSLVTTGGEADDWTARTLLYKTTARADPGEGTRTSRVSADGRTLMFTSRAGVTGYNNHGAESDCTEQEAAAPCNEVYVYAATADHVTCVSCNPQGTPATRDALLYHLENDGFTSPPTLYPWDLPRNLSGNGSKIFFETEEALLPKDTNSQMDIYEWEREGAGSCPAARSGGCLDLISSGVSSEPSYFAEASTSASDVFFFTRQSLVGQDDDELVDLYDAREAGGIAAQNPLAPVEPCQGEACHPAQVPAPGTGIAVSQVYSGPGSITPQPEVPPVGRPKPKLHHKALVHHKARARAHHKGAKRKGRKRVRKVANHADRRSK